MGRVCLDGGQPSVVVRITLHPDGALSVEGPMHDKPFLLAMLDNARCAVKNHGFPTDIIVPTKDVRV